MIETCATVENVAYSIQERNEIILHVPNDLDLLARLFGVLASQRRSVLGWCFYSDRERVTVIVIATNDNQAVCSLEAAGFECASNSVIVFPHQLRRFSISQLSTELRRAGVDVFDVHACGSRQDGPLLVLKTGDTRQTLQVLETMDLFRPDSMNQSVAPPMESLEPAIK